MMWFVSNFNVDWSSKLNKDLDKAVAIATDPIRLSNLIWIWFSCKNLPNMDNISKTDAFIVLFEAQNGKLQEIGWTEVVTDCLDP